MYVRTWSTQGIIHVMLSLTPYCVQHERLMTLGLYLAEAQVFRKAPFCHANLFPTTLPSDAHWCFGKRVIFTVHTVCRTQGSMSLFSCTVNRYTCYSVAYLTEWLLCFPVALNPICCYHSNHRRPQINGDRNHFKTRFTGQKCFVAYSAVAMFETVLCMRASAAPSC